MDLWAHASFTGRMASHITIDEGGLVKITTEFQIREGASMMELEG